MALTQASKRQSVFLCWDLPLLGLESIADYDANLASALTEKERLLCSNAKAEQQAVQAGVSIATALSLCADLRLVPRAPQREKALLQRLCLWAWEFTPHLSYYPESKAGESQTGHYHLLLDISSCLRLFGGIRAIIDSMSEGFKELAVTAYPALADTPEAARLIARSQADQSQLLKANGELDLTALKSLLAQQSIQDLSISPAQKQKLRSTGIERLAQLQPLPASAIARRFGIELGCYLQQLLGLRPDPRPVFEPPATFRQSLEFLMPVKQQQGLQSAIESLCRSLSRFLQARQLQTQLLRWQCRLEDRSEAVFEVQLSSPANDLERFLSLTHLRMENLNLRDGVISIGLSADQVSQTKQAVLSLFSKQATLSPEALIERLETRLGDNSVKGLKELDQHLPERAWQWVDLKQKSTSGPIPTKDKPTKDKPTKDKPAKDKLRPLYLLPHPIRISKQKDQPYWQGALTLLSATERIEGQWWQSPVSRDYFIARAQQGQMCWLYRERGNGQWFLHGLFA